MSRWEERFKKAEMALTLVVLHIFKQFKPGANVLYHGSQGKLGLKIVLSKRTVPNTRNAQKLNEILHMSLVLKKIKTNL